MPDSPASVTFRRARAADLRAIVALLADDEIGGSRERLEDPLPAAYGHAFAAIDRDPNHLLIVGEQDGAVVGCLQLAFLPGLSHQGGWRAQIENVRVARALRGRRAGEAMMQYAIARARERNCLIVQLTSDKRRGDAVRFYQRLGFVPSHEGLKLMLR